MMKFETARRFGYRKPGGYYLIGSGPAVACCLLPIELLPCNCCGAVIKQTRGFQWVTASQFLKFDFGCRNDMGCDLFNIGENQIGLMWVGNKFYPSTIAFLREANLMGISKRLNTIPANLKLGTTWVALAHPNAVIKYGQDGTPEFYPGIFMLFRPTALEYVKTGLETPERLKEIEAKGVTVVEVVAIKDPQLSIDGIETDG